MKLNHLLILSFSTFLTAQNPSEAKTIAKQVHTVRTSNVTINGWENSLTAKDRNLKNFFWIPLQACKQSSDTHTIYQSNRTKSPHYQSARLDLSQTASKFKAGKNSALSRTSIESVQSALSYGKTYAQVACPSTAAAATSVSACLLKK